MRSSSKHLHQQASPSAAPPPSDNIWCTISSSSTSSSCTTTSSARSNKLVMAEKRLSEEQKEFIKCFLLQHSTKRVTYNNAEMKLHKGMANVAATKFNVSARRIYKIWEDMRKCDKLGVAINVKRKFAGPKRPKMQVDRAKVLEIEHKKRRTIRTLAANLGVSRATVGRWKKRGELRAATSAVHPLITEEHKLARLKWCLKAIKVDETGETKFKSMDNIVHIDEKWFYMDQVSERYILLPDEETPYKAVINKNFIPKLMFMCAVSRPFYGPNGELLWDGRLGIWPIAEEVIAKYNSKNRPAGAVEIKGVPSVVDRKVIKELLLIFIIPAIKKYWPSCLSKDITIQQDNAPAHVAANDHEVWAACHSGGFNITIVNQPKRSPDTNVNDLGFFNSIQCLQQEMQLKTAPELIDAVQLCFEVLDHQTLDDVFLTCQRRMVEVMKVKGHNKYQQPHMGKARLRALGILPRDLMVDKALVKDCIEYLLELREQIDNPILLEALGYGN